MLYFNYYYYYYRQRNNKKITLLTGFGTIIIHEERRNRNVKISILLGVNLFLFRVCVVCVVCACVRVCVRVQVVFDFSFFNSYHCPDSFIINSIFGLLLKQHCFRVTCYVLSWKFLRFFCFFLYFKIKRTSGLKLYMGLLWSLIL